MDPVELQSLTAPFGELHVQSHLDKSHQNADIYKKLSEQMKVREHSQCQVKAKEQEYLKARDKSSKALVMLSLPAHKMNIWITFLQTNNATSSLKNFVVDSFP